jgi:hypothetical protein
MFVCLLPIRYNFIDMRAKNLLIFRAIFTKTKIKLRIVSDYLIKSCYDHRKTYNIKICIYHINHFDICLSKYW